MRADSGELITNGSKAIRGYDPLTGKELWRLLPIPKSNPHTILARELIYVTSGYAPIQPIYAIRPGATGTYHSGGKTPIASSPGVNSAAVLYADAFGLQRYGLIPARTRSCYGLQR